MLMTRRAPRATRAVAIVTAALLTLPLAACGGDGGGASAPDGKTTIEFVWWGSDARAKVTNEAVALFQKKHTNITVKTSFGQFDPYFQQLSTRIAGGNAPDVLQMDRGYLREYADRNALLDLGEQISSGVLKTADHTQSLLPAGQIEGKTFAIPVAQNTQTVWYDPAVFKKAGVEPPSATWTYQQAQDAGAKIKAATGGKTTLFGDFGYAIDWFDVWLNQRGKSIYTDGKVGWTEADLTEFWTMTGKIRQAGAIVAPEVTTQQDGSIQNSSLIKKAAAAEFNYDSGFTGAVAAYGAPLELGPVPSDTDKRGMAAQMSMAFSVAKGSKHPKEAAMLIDFLLNDVEAGKILGVSRGVPVNSKVRDAIEPNLGPDDKKVMAYEKSVASLLLPTPAPQPKGGGAVKAEFQKVYDEVIFNKLTPAAGAKRLFEQTQSLLG